MSWKRAFEDAKATEAEGAKSFDGFFKKSKIEGIVSNIEDKTVPSIDDYNERSEFKPTFTKAVEKEDVERGGFCQPSGLAAFVKFHNKKSNTDIQKNDEIAYEITVKNKLDQNLDEGTKLEELDQGLINDVHNPDENEGKENGMARQMCRAWLKNTYLQLGQPCKNQKCERRHLIEGKSVGSLYKDFSFKGLTTAQRNSIINQVQSAAAADAHPVTIIPSGITRQSIDSSKKVIDTESVSDIQIDPINSNVISHESSDVLSDDKGSKLQLDSFENTPTEDDLNMDISVQEIQLTGSDTQEILHGENVSLDSKNEKISCSNNYSHIEVEFHVGLKSNVEIKSCDTVIEETICDDTGSLVGDKSSKKKKRAKKNGGKIEGSIKAEEPCTAQILKDVDINMERSVGVKSGKKNGAKKHNDQKYKNIKTNFDGDVIITNENPLVEMESSTSIVKNVKAGDLNVSNISGNNMQYLKENNIDRNERNKITDTNVPFNSIDHHGTMNDAYIAQKNKLNNLLKKPRSSWTPTHQN